MVTDLFSSHLIQEEHGIQWKKVNFSQHIIHSQIIQFTVMSHTVKSYFGYKLQELDFLIFRLKWNCKLRGHAYKSKVSINKQPTYSQGTLLH